MVISELSMDPEDLIIVRNKVRSNFIDYAKSIGVVIYGLLFGIGYKGKSGLHDSMAEAYGFWGAILIMSVVLVPVVVLFYFLAYFKASLDYLRKKKLRITHVVVSSGGPYRDDSCYLGLLGDDNKMRSYAITADLLDEYTIGDPITYDISRHDKLLLRIVRNGYEDHT